MRRTVRTLVAIGGLLVGLAAHGFNVGTPTTFSKLIWAASFNAPGVTSCNQLVFDATGDLMQSDTLVLAGSLNCPAIGGGFGMIGSLYLAVDGSLNITMTAATYTIACPRVVGWFGSCTLFDAAGITRGTGTLRLL